MRYANDTSVSVAKSRGEIEDLVQRAGGTKFATMSEEDRAVILFELNDRRVMFELPLPTREQFRFRVKGRSQEQVEQPADRIQRDWEQACRSSWRALALAIKAKLVSIDSKVETFEEAFLAHIVVPGRGGKAQRFSHLAVKAIAEAYTGGTLPPLLGSGS